MSTLTYPTYENRFETNIRFYFISTGDDLIVKAVDYSYISDFQGKRVFNLAFGDYDEVDDKINDCAHSNNGDVYKVFNTILNTIPKFFATFGDDMMMVQGSDSRQNFGAECKLTCKKGCADSDSCRNKDRRISVYTRYVNNNYDVLIKEYVFYGGLRIAGAISIEPYSPDKKYDSVFVIKK